MSEHIVFITFNNSLVIGLEPCILFLNRLYKY